MFKISKLSYSTTQRKKILIALGGNAIKKPKDAGTSTEMFTNLQKASQSMIRLTTHHKYNLAITHGNGPQIGSLYLQNQLTSSTIPSMSLHICDSMTQGQIGYMLQQSLNNELINNNIKHKGCLSIITQVEVNINDNAFNNPTKPIGKFYNKDESDKMINEYGYKMIEDSGRGYRIVVPSPKPVRIVESNGICKLVDDGYIVIACGGGGIPVLNNNGILSGIDAVIDKDLTAVKMGIDINCDILNIATDVDGVYLDYLNEKKRKKLNELNINDAIKYLENGEFGKGSMRPKIEAGIQFVEQTGKECIICSLENIEDAILGKNGTRIVANTKKY